MENKKSFEIEVLERLIALETLIKQQDFSKINATALEANNRSKSNEEKIKELKNNQTWLVRLVLSAVILGILAIIYGM